MTIAVLVTGKTELIINNCGLGDDDRRGVSACADHLSSHPVGCIVARL